MGTHAPLEINALVPVRPKPTRPKKIRVEAVLGACRVFDAIYCKLNSNEGAKCFYNSVPPALLPYHLSIAVFHARNVFLPICPHVRVIVLVQRVAPGPSSTPVRHPVTHCPHFAGLRIYNAHVPAARTRQHGQRMGEQAP